MNLRSKPYTRSLAHLFAFTALLVSGLASAESADGYRVLDVEDGIEVALKEEPGRVLPIMRGKGNVEGDILHVLAVILDAPRGIEWAEGASKVEYLGEHSVEHALIYTVTELTWPISDRDFVIERKITDMTKGETYRIAYQGKPNAHPKQDGRVRSPEAMLSFTLKRVDAHTTFITYEARVDPGGNLPKWLVRWASKNVPYKTIKSLRKQVAKTRGQYKAEIAELAAK